MAKVDIGKDFENHVSNTLDALKARKAKIDYIRLYDTRSARLKYLPAQPCDFIIGYANTTSLVECKASLKHKSLRSCLSGAVTDVQAAKAKMWIGTGNYAMFMFHSVLTSKIEVWDGLLVSRCRAESKPLPKDGQLHVMRYSDLINYFNHLAEGEHPCGL